MTVWRYPFVPDRQSQNDESPPIKQDQIYKVKNAASGHEYSSYRTTQVDRFFIEWHW